MRKVYTADALAREKADKYQGKNTGDETQTEQEYLPMAVKVKRFFSAGEILQAKKLELYDIGWDEEFNMNTIPVPPERTPGFGLVEAQEEYEGAVDRLKEQQEAAQQEPINVGDEEATDADSDTKDGDGSEEKDT